ncbi:MAG TPA: YihY/virulence factor BrkB family protein [Chloroflexota bacterium]|nr:YihY/virulence factor BrkB family protein [Chloroflexota bacterium]
MIGFAKTFFKKWSKDNVGMLASVIAWNCLTSIVPIMVGLLAITGVILKGNPSAQHSVVSHLSAALHGVLTPKDLNTLVKASIRHSGLLGIVGFLGVLWGGSNVGGAISTAFQAIFETSGRNFIKEKLLDIVMIFVIAILMIVIIVGTTAATLVTKLFSGFPLSGGISLLIGTAIGLIAAFILFSAIYLAFPHVKMNLRLANVWKGAVAAAVLFTALSYIWPIYSHFAHFSRYGAVLFPILMLTAWLYFFSMIVCVGAELVAIGAIDEAEQKHEPEGPEPQETVPQHRVLRGEPARREREKAGAGAGG